MMSDSLIKTLLQTYFSNTQQTQPYDQETGDGSGMRVPALESVFVSVDERIRPSECPSPFIEVGNTDRLQPYSSRRRL